LVSDNAKSQFGKAVCKILRMFQCEPHHHHQNFAERRIQEVIKLSNTLLDCTCSAPSLWLLCVQYVYLLNLFSTESLHLKTPLEAATGQRPDVSAFMAFNWYQPVYFKHYMSTSANPSFPFESQERLGTIVDIAEQKGDRLTFLVLDLVTKKNVAWSELRSGLYSTKPNIGTIMAPYGCTSASGKTIQSHTDAIEFEIPTTLLKIPRFSPDELVGKSFVGTLENGKKYCATFVQKIQDHDAENHTQYQISG
jgi:hypothetical protein